VNLLAGGVMNTTTGVFTHLGGGDVMVTGGLVRAVGADNSRTGAVVGIKMVGDNVTQGPASQMESTRLAASAIAGISLVGDNLVNKFSASNTGAPGVEFRQRAANPLEITGLTSSGGNVVLMADDLNITGAVNVGPNTLTLLPTTASRNIGIQTGDVASALSLSTMDLSFVTAGTLDIGRSDNSGTGTLTVTAFPGALNVGTVRMFAKDIFWTASAGTPGSELAHNFELRAADNLNIVNSTLLFDDGVNVVLVANNDGNTVGHLKISN
jgi:hypothetical protein